MSAPPRLDDEDVLFDRCVEAWRVAGRELGFEVIAPFTCIAGGAEHRCLAYVPHFGGQRGAIAFAYAQRSRASSAAWDGAVAAGHFASQVNAAVYADYDRDRFIEMLSDWGYFGPAATRPEWLVD